MAACGGGGGDGGSDSNVNPVTVADPADKYVGQWVTYCYEIWPLAVNPSYPNGLSAFEEVTITKANANEYMASYVESEHLNTTCAGPVSNQTNASGIAQIQGAKNVAFGEVDKVLVEKAGVSRKALAQVQGGLLYFTSATRPGVTLDVEGFPQSIVLTAFLTRKPS